MVSSAGVSMGRRSPSAVFTRWPSNTSRRSGRSSHTGRISSVAVRWVESWHWRWRSGCRPTEGRAGQIQPHGPYFLGGGSLGGIVALEMAQRLQADGEAIGLLTMFDSWGPTWFSTEHQPAAPARFWRRIGGHVRRAQREGAAGEAKLLYRRGIDRLLGYGRLAAARVLRVTGSELPHNLRYFYVEEANLAALRRYV